MTTIRDVSKAAGVSKTTVTRVIREPEKVSEKTRIKVQETIKALQYRPNMLSQTFRNKSTKTIVVLMPNMANPLFAQIISGIENRAREQGYRVLVGDTGHSDERESQYIDLVETQLADGILQLNSRSDSLERLSGSQAPAVCIAGVGTQDLPAVKIDNVSAAHVATKHLIELGHRRIGIVTGPDTDENTKARLEGYKHGLAKAGIMFDPELVFEGDFRAESGLLSAKVFYQSSNCPTAFFCMNDEMAFGLIKGFDGLGLKTPDDISVVGFDDIAASAFSVPGLTTISQPAVAMGENGFEMLLQIIEDEPLPQKHMLLDFEFKQRGSTKKLPN